ncbi:MrpH family fimbial adhesin [Serratia fonticola]
MINKIINMGRSCLIPFLLVLSPASLAESVTVGRIFVSSPDSEDKITIRAVEWTAAAPASIILSCEGNKNPETETCMVEVSCYLKSYMSFPASSSALSWGQKYRMTKADLRALVYNKVGSKIMYPGCFRKSPSGKYTFIQSPYIYVGSLPIAGGTTTNFDVYYFGAVDMIDPAPNLSCKATSTNATIDFGEVLYNSVNGSTKSATIDISCTNGGGFAHVSSVSYDNSTGVLLRPDGSLSALMEFNDVPADVPSSYYIENNTSRSLVIKATLRSTNALKGGLFSGSLVVNITYD